MEKLIPQIKSYKGHPTLFVENEPFVILGGEIHNSAASDATHMEDVVWPNLQDLGMNTVVAPVYWECLEPEEGVFDFSQVEFLLKQARREKMKLVLLWFGLWKNAESMYVPAWMKKDTETYFRCRNYYGEAMPIISPFCQEAVEKDQTAFCRLMTYLKEQDGKEHTVILVQVENEIGLLGSERDYSPAANALFQPEDYEKDPEETFMAYGFARAVQQIAQAGQAIYPLPMYVNAWLEQYPWRPGTYPSGGPVMKMAYIWKKEAPAIFTLAPDIYVPSVPQVMEEYTRADNPLFVPEVRKDAVAAAYAMYAVFGCHGIGFSPFGIEELRMDPEEIDKPPMEVMLALNIDPSAFDIEGSGEYLKASYHMIGQLLPLYYELRGEHNRVQAWVRRESRESGCVFSFEKYDIQVDYTPGGSGRPTSGGVVLALSPHEFIVAGMMSKVNFLNKIGQHDQIEILRLEEGSFVQGSWKRRRILNGDEKMRIVLPDMPTLYRIEVNSY